MKCFGLITKELEAKVMGLLEEDLKRRFSDKSETGLVDAEGIWTSVSEALDSSKGNRPSGYWKWARIAGVVLIVGAIGAYFLENHDGSILMEEVHSSSVEVQLETSEKSEVKKQSIPSDIANDVVKPDASIEELAGQENLEINEQSRPGSGSHRNAIIEPVVTDHDSSEPDRVLVNSSGILESPDVGQVYIAALDLNEDIENLSDISSPEESANSKVIKENLTVQYGQEQDANPYETGDRSSDIIGYQKSSAEEYVSNTDLEKEILILTPLSIEELDSTPLKKRAVVDRLTDRGIESKDPNYYARKIFGPTELTLSLGVDFIMPKFENSGSALNLNDLTKSIPGYSTSLMGTWISDKGLRFSAGLEYAKLRTKFDYSSERDIAYLDEDRLVYYELDIQGDTINAVYEDTWLTATETRTILHHNEVEILAIPVAVGYEQDFGRIGVGLDVGLSYGFILSQSGRSIDAEGSIADFDMKDGTDTPFKSSLLAYSVSPIFDYLLSDGFSVRLSPQLKFIPKSDSEFHGLEQSATIFRMTGGLTYRLK